MGFLKWFGRPKVAPPQAEDATESADPTHSAPGVVFARLTNTTIVLHLFPAAGLADGGIPYELELEQVPPELRMPNTRVEVALDRATGAVVAVKRQAPDTEFYGGKFVPIGSRR
jgi:hypothetical protein